MISRHVQFSVPILIVLVMSGNKGFTQEANDKNNELPKVEMLTLKVRVLDPDEHPVEGATVKPRGLRTKVQRADWWGWRTDRDGDVPEILSNSEGYAEVPYPKYVMEKLETGTLNLNVTHPDFVQFDSDRSVDAKPATVNLERGFRIAVTAIDADTGERIKTNVNAVVSVRATGKWEQKKGGMLVSPTLKKMDCVLRVVHFEEGKPTKFSQRIEVKPNERSRVLLKDVKLAMGTRVEGRIDDTVPRPIKNGHVSARVDRDVKSENRGRNSWNWSDKAEIKEDGTFVFESIPNDEVLQLIPVCDGWVPDEANKADVLKYFPDEMRQLNNDWAALPQLVKTEGNSVEAVLPMIPAKSVNVTVLGPNDKPLAGTEVACGPNQYWFDGGSQILGAAFSSRDYMISPEEVANSWSSYRRYQVVTDDNGMGVIKNLPDTRLARSLSVKHAQHELPVDGRSREMKFEFAKEGVTEVTLKLQKKGTDVMDGSQAEEEQNDLNTARNVVAWVKDFIDGWFK